MIPRLSKRTAIVLVLVVTLFLAGCTGPGGGATTPANGTVDEPMEPGTADQTPEPGDDGVGATDTPAAGDDGAAGTDEETV